ncbi:hypothetical protein [Oculatella sp. LEGE 06141]|uniref:hypothetical protein n=1 Tax=Oculatella sp. LEGE 06141 TaxID=1828648 RepID=UPI001D138A89|nr:hypothetical protein [Oculatella sp. LEGE 06141]
MPLQTLCIFQPYRIGFPVSTSAAHQSAATVLAHFSNDSREAQLPQHQPIAAACSSAHDPISTIATLPYDTRTLGSKALEERKNRDFAAVYRNCSNEEVLILAARYR